MFNERQEKLNQEKALTEFIDSLIKFFSENQSQTTTVIDNPLGEYRISQNLIPIFRTDHFIGNTFRYSRYTAIFKGIRISRKTYKELTNILGALK